MNGRIARVAGGVVVVLASLAAGHAGARADDADQKIEKRVVVRTPGSGRLGVSIADPEGDVRGAAVKSVADDSAAQKAGIQEGDVIVRFDGETVRSASQLRRLVAETPSNRAVAIEVLRAGTTQKLTATLAEGTHEFHHFEGPRAFRFDGPRGLKEWTLHMPDFDVEAPEPPEPPLPPGAPGAPPAPPRAPRAWTWHGDPGDFAFKMMPGGPRKLGIEYTEMGEQLAAYFKLSGKAGVLVTSVDADGPAARGGLKAGDVIVKLAGDTIEDAGDLREALADAEGGSEVAVTVQRDGRPVELKVTLAKPAERKVRRSSSSVSL
jgi:S1-C subfamily serine protease